MRKFSGDEAQYNTAGYTLLSPQFRKDAFALYHAVRKDLPAFISVALFRLTLTWRHNFEALCLFLTGFYLQDAVQGNVYT